MTDQERIEELEKAVKAQGEAMTDLGELVGTMVMLMAQVVAWKLEDHGATDAVDDLAAAMAEMQRALDKSERPANGSHP